MPKIIANSTVVLEIEKILFDIYVETLYTDSPWKSTYSTTELNPNGDVSSTIFGGFAVTPVRGRSLDGALAREPA